jgi:CRISPR-associated protein Cas1
MYSPGALDLRNTTPHELPRIEDRITWLFIEHAQITQTRTGLVAWQESGERIEIPCATIGALLCGPGTSITHDAAGTLYNAGCVLLWTSTFGVTGYQAAVPLTGSAKWMQAHARMWADPEARHAAAVSLYRGRLPEELPSETLTLAQLRGFEGQMVKAAYRQHIRKQGLSGWRRDVTAPDSVNVCLNIGNSILYACALSACSALAISPGLGIIHQGTVAALLYDLADLHKVAITIPAAFKVHKDPDPPSAMRRAVRTALHKQQLPQFYLRTLTGLLAPHVHSATDDYLLDDDGEFVQGHKNWDGR